MIFVPPSPVLLDVPHIEQKNNGECLAACAAMVCAYKGISVRYNRLVRVLATKEDLGTAFYNIRNLEKLGLQVVYEKFATLEILYNLLLDDWPCIVGVQTLPLPHWNKVDIPHAVVLMGMAENDVYLNDPAFSDAIFTAPIGEFDLAWLERDEEYAVLSR